MTTISCNNSIYIVPCNSVFLLRIYSPYARIHAYIPMPLVISCHVSVMWYRHRETHLTRPLVADWQLLIAENLYTHCVHYVGIPFACPPSLQNFLNASKTSFVVATFSSCHLVLC